MSDKFCQVQKNKDEYTLRYSSAKGIDVIRKGHGALFISISIAFLDRVGLSGLGLVIQARNLTGRNRLLNHPHEWRSPFPREGDKAAAAGLIATATNSICNYVARGGGGAKRAID